MPATQRPGIQQVILKSGGLPGTIRLTVKGALTGRLVAGGGVVVTPLTDGCAWLGTQVGWGEGCHADR